MSLRSERTAKERQGERGGIGPGEDSKDKRHQIKENNGKKVRVEEMEKKTGKGEGRQM